MFRVQPLRVGTCVTLALSAAIALGPFRAGTAEAAAILTSQVPQDVANHSAARVSTPDPSRELRLAIALPMRHRAELEQLVHDIYDPSSREYRHYLSVAEFTARFGPTQADYAKALEYFSTHGLAITGTAANRYLIESTASVATLERMLHVKFGLYRRAGEGRRFIAPDREPSLDLSVPILRIIGLDDANPPTNRLAQRKIDATTQSPVNGSGPNGWYLGSDIRLAYYGIFLTDGKDQSVGLMELGPYDPQGVQTYFENFGPPLTTAVVPISTDGSPATCSRTCNDAEQDLDIEYAVSMAPGLAQVQVYVARSPASVLNRMATDNTSAQLSTSWGWSHRERPVDEPLFLEMAVQGQTLLTASGDYSSLRASGPWPEESAYITSVGGTDLLTSSPGGPWLSETAWSGSAGGPSLDKTIKIPAYQAPFINDQNQGSHEVRNVPDIAGDANTVNYICYSRGCSGGNGGTSFASPIWAGFIALANQRAAHYGYGRIGFLNPLLYGMARKPSADYIYHDIVSGTSGKYTAVPSYDLVTGFGSPQGFAFIEKLIQAANP
ncbi:MAG TPA: S53 family peptidase [Rhodanobacteraceae bacterium]|nr:S53 family peptidase [Rhodanobacteraceae bacterium]